jgi:kumamolisin
VTARRRGTVALAALFVFAASCSAGGPTRHGATPTVTPTQWFSRYLGPTDPATVLRFSVVLPLRTEAVDGYLRDLYDPESPRFHHFLDAEAFGRRFGLTGRDVDRVRRDLASRGFEVGAPTPQRTALEVRGTAREVSDAFDTTLGEFRTRSGRRYHAPLSEPVVPSEIRPWVNAVAGLNGAAMPSSNAVPRDGLKPVDVAKAYDIEPLHDMGLDGKGLTIAILSFAGFHPEEIRAWDQITGTTGPAPKSVKVNGGAGAITDAEVALDIEVIRGIAPKAQILSYEAPRNSSITAMGTIIDQVVADGKADIISNSWGLCDERRLSDGRFLLSLGDRARVAQSLAAAAAAGVTMFSASGDSGAFDCQNHLLSDHRPSTDFPASLANLVAVGGTRLSVREDGTYFAEAGWEDVMTASGGGGGLSPVDKRPDYQRGVPGIDNKLSNGKRQVPDVSASADPDSGFFTVFIDPQSGQTVAQPIGGTSAAAPFWAGSMLLVSQFAKQQGVKRLGFVAPLLYQIAGDDDPTAPAFHDVVIGGDRLHEATKGWDYSTGLGSPDVFNLANAVVARLG